LFTPPEPQFFNICWRLKSRLFSSRRAAFAKVREYNRALAGKQVLCVDGKTLLCKLNKIIKVAKLL
jgi:hypothetical protein